MRNTIQKLMCMFLLLGATYVYGQRTAYENKVIEIKAKYLRKFGMPAQEVEVLRKRGDFLLDSALNEQANKYEKRYGNAVMLATLLEMRKEIKEAEKLKTTADLNKEIRAKKESEEYGRKEEAKRKEEERKREAAAEEERKAEAIKKAKEMTVYRIKEDINEHFHHWAKRGEFEKTEDYNKRMSQKKEYLDKLVFRTFVQWIRGTESGTGFRPEINLLQYDVDKEEYQIKVTGSFLKRGGWSFVQQGTINVDVETAKKMKEKRTLYLNDDISINDIVIIDDSYIFIDKFKFDGKYYPIKINAPYTKLLDYTLSTEELGLTEYFLENNNVNLSGIKSVDPESNRAPKLKLSEGLGTLIGLYAGESIDREKVKGKGVVKAEINVIINEDCSIGVVVKGDNASFNKEVEKAAVESISKRKICEKPAMVDGIPAKHEVKIPISMNLD